MMERVWGGYVLPILRLHERVEMHNMVLLEKLHQPRISVVQELHQHLQEPRIASIIGRVADRMVELLQTVPLRLQAMVDR